jgi:hypothetical protein
MMSKKCCTSGQATDDNRTRRISIACWIPKAINTHSEYVTLIASLLQQWLLEQASVVRHTHIACVVINAFLGGRG